MSFGAIVGIKGDADYNGKCWGLTRSYSNVRTRNTAGEIVPAGCSQFGSREPGLRQVAESLQPEQEHPWLCELQLYPAFTGTALSLSFDSKFGVKNLEEWMLDVARNRSGKYTVIVPPRYEYGPSCHLCLAAGGTGCRYQFETSSGWAVSMSVLKISRLRCYKDFCSHSRV